MPALLTTMSTCPNSCTAVSIRVRPPAAVATDEVSATAAPPASLISRTTSCAGEDEEPEPLTEPPMSLTTTAAPSEANSRACERPRPAPAPVTTATRPRNGASSSDDTSRLRSGGRAQAGNLGRYLQSQETRVQAAVDERSTHDPEAVLSGALPHVPHDVVLVEPPDRADAVGDVVPEQLAHALLLVLVPGGQHDHVELGVRALRGPETGGRESVD